MATVALKSVHKSYGQVPVIHGVSADIEDGEFVTLVGPSGCGKSTLLRMIAGLETITQGDIVIGGRVVNDLPPKARDIAMVFQSYALYPHMTVAKNMGHPLKIAGRPKAEIDQRVRETAQILGLSQLLDRRPKELSGGQRQRVAMGRAIVRDPKVFLFDEPLSNLDAKLRVQMRAEIKELHQRLRTTTVYVTHDQVEAMTMADRIVVMNAGIVEQVGKPLELYDRPSSMFVAGFLGSPAMNLIKGSVEAADGAPVFCTPDGNAIRLPNNVATGISGRSIYLGIRPEHLMVEPDGGPHGFGVKVAVVEPTGAETLIISRMGGTSITTLLHERLEFEVGSTLRLVFPSTKLHFFDAATGRRIDPH